MPNNRTYLTMPVPAISALRANIKAVFVGSQPFTAVLGYLGIIGGFTGSIPCTGQYGNIKPSGQWFSWTDDLPLLRVINDYSNSPRTPQKRNPGRWGSRCRLDLIDAESQNPAAGGVIYV